MKTTYKQNPLASALVGALVFTTAKAQQVPTEALFAGYEEQEPQIQRGRVADALCRRQIARQGQGKQLAARARRDVLALHPLLLARAGGAGWHMAAADHREGEVNRVNREGCLLSSGETARDFTRTNLLSIIFSALASAAREPPLPAVAFDSHVRTAAPFPHSGLPLSNRSRWGRPYATRNIADECSRCRRVER
jgi:hypothetical protein